MMMIMTEVCVGTKVSTIHDALSMCSHNHKWELGPLGEEV